MIEVVLVEIYVIFLLTNYQILQENFKMKREFFVGIFVSLLTLAVWIPTTVAQEEPIIVTVTEDDFRQENGINTLSDPQELSPGCRRANSPWLDDSWGGGTVYGAVWNAGETLTATVLSGASSGQFSIVVDGDTVATGARPGTLTYTFQTTGWHASVSWAVVPLDTNVPWEIDCNIHPPNTPPLALLLAQASPAYGRPIIRWLK